MHKGNECNKCYKFNVCKLLTEYSDKAISLTDYNDNDYVSKLECKHYEEKKK